MTFGIKTILYPVKDLTQAKKLYGELVGKKPDADSAYYVGYNVEGQHIGLVPESASPATGAVAYWHVRDIRQSLKLLLESGATTHQEIKNVGGTRLVGSVKDPDGNIIGLLQD